MKGKVGIILCMALLVLCPLTVTTYCIDSRVSDSNQEVVSSYNFRESSYEESLPIYISNNSDFANQASINSWDGNGSESNPYIIEGYNITTSSDSAIYIVNTTVYFEVRGCFIVGGTTGVVLENVTYANFWNNTVQESDSCGFFVGKSDSCIVTNNTIHTITGSDSTGLYSFDSDDCNLSNNTIQSVSGTGILIDYSGNCSITDNFVSGSSNDGVRLRDSSGINITQNVITDSGMSGIKLGNSPDCRLEWNLVGDSVSDGISIEMSFACLVQDNVLYDNGAYSLDVAGDSTDILSNTFYRSQMQGLRCQSDNNYVTQNNFIENSLAFSGNAIYIHNAGTNNNITSNYYDIWTWPDEDEDEIVDLPYSSDGSIDNQPHVRVFMTDLMHILTKPRLIYPNETLAGEKFWGITEIIWGVSSDTFGHDVTYNASVSADGGSSWIEIAHNLTVTSLDWMSSDFTESDEYRFRILAQCTEGLISEYTTGAEYEVKNHTLSIPTIITPNGGETIFGNYTIMWNDAVESWGLPVTYQVYYSQDAGDTWNELVSYLEDTSFLWDIRGIPDGDQYLVRIVASSEAGLMSEDVSDLVFTISKPNITFIAASIAGGAIVIVIVAYMLRKRGTV
jgi:parallel beta-helix repeat protein